MLMKVFNAITERYELEMEKYIGQNGVQGVSRG
jgi:hypothetical protein